MVYIQSLFRKHKLLFVLSMIFTGLSSIAIALISLCVMYPRNQALAYSIAGLFWVNLLVSQILFWSANVLRHRIEEQIKKEGRRPRKARIGVVSFFQNKESMLCDIALFAMILLLLLLFVFKVKTEWLLLLCIAIIFMLFNLHSLLNGINYLYIKNIKKYEK